MCQVRGRMKEAKRAGRMTQKGRVKGAENDDKTARIEKFSLDFW